MIDVFEGEPVPVDVMQKGTFDFMPWVACHNLQMTLPITQKVVTAPRAQGATTFGMTCYCYGGRIGMNLAKFENATKAVVISHPSLLQVPADFEKVKAKSLTALFINS